MGILEKLSGWFSGKEQKPRKTGDWQNTNAGQKEPSGPFCSPIWFCGPMGEQIVQDLKKMGLWEPMCFGEEKNLPVHPWFPSRSWYDHDKACYHLEEYPCEVSYQGTDGERFRWELLLTVVTASGFAKYPKGQLPDSMGARYSHIVQCLSRVYAVEYPLLREGIETWLRELNAHSAVTWCFSRESLSYRINAWTPVTQQEFNRIVKEAELSDTYFQPEDPSGIQYRIQVKDRTVTFSTVDAGMARGNSAAFIYATREEALGHALELMRQYQCSYSTSPEKKEKAQYQKVAEITVTPVRQQHYWRCELVLEHWCGRWQLQITDVFAKDKYNDAKDVCRVPLPPEFPNMTDKGLAAVINSVSPTGPGYDGYRAVRPEEVAPLLEAAKNHNTGKSGEIPEHKTGNLSAL